MDKPPVRQQSIEREDITETANTTVPNGHATTNGHASTNGHTATNGHAAQNGHAATNGHAKKSPGTPEDSPRDVFPEDDLPRPRSRGSVARESFRIELTPEDIRHRKEQALRKQKHIIIGLLIFFSTILVLGSISSIHWYVQNEALWHITLSQLAGIFGIFLIAIIVNIVCLYKVYKKERLQRIDWTDPEVSDY